MGQAREVMDKVTAAILTGDRNTIAKLYAEDAVAHTPDEGRLVGRAAIADYLAGFGRAFPTISWEPISQFEVGDTAIDEGFVIGHRLHYDQIDMLTQLGLMGSSTIVLPEPAASKENAPA